MTDKRVTFKASYPAIQSAIKVDGQGGARIQLDIPESELMNFLPAMAWRGEVMQVSLTLTELDNGQKTGAECTDEGTKDRRSIVGRRRA